jgi:hypothetical protein
VPRTADQLPPAQPSTQPFGPQSVGDDWTPAKPFQLWHATKLTVLVGANPVMVRLSRSQPPEPPEWDYPFTLAPGPWSHAGPFGYWQFRNAQAGAAAVVQGAAFRE